jgi:Peptidase A4 family
MKNLSSTLAVLLVLAAPLASKAQSQNPNEFPTNLAGATTIAAPPEGFDVFTASDEQLADYGFPPRPNEAASPEDYAVWAKAMTASKTRIVPKLEQTNVFHGPAKLKAESESSEENTLQSYNWSGYVDFSGAKKYGSSSFYYLITDVVVPVAQQAFGACTGGWDYGSSWVGIDGDESNDVLQAGLEFDAYCSGGTTATFYSPWYEWFPFGEVRITNLPIAPGDDYFVEVWHTSATQGYAYLVNLNTDQSVEVGFTAPSGTTLIGNSAEWITERPGLSTGLSTLTNYIADPYWSAFAYTEKGKKSDPGSSKAIIMLDNNGKKISVPTLLGNSAFVVEDQGSAY